MDHFKHQNNSIIQRIDTNVQSYMAQVYGWMTVGLLLTSFVSWYAINNNNIILFLSMHKSVLMGLIISECALVIGLSFLLHKITGAVATTMFMLYSMLTGLTVSLILVAYTGTSIVSTFFITATMFASLSFYGYVTKKNLSGFGSFLFMFLVGITIASLLNIWLNNSKITLLVTYIGVLVFSGLTAYDTQKLKDMANKIENQSQEGIRKHAIVGALTLYLDFVNLFLMMLRIVGDDRR